MKKILFIAVLSFGFMANAMAQHFDDEEEVVEKKFSEVKLANEYPEIYEACKVEVKTNKEITKASNDRLVITLPKEEE